MSDRRLGCTRRGFITAAFSGLVSTSLIGVPSRRSFSQEADTTSEGKGKGILRRKLGKTGIELPVVSMGVMNADNPGVVRASYEIGVRHFDTAAHYQGGRNEEMVGKVIGELGVRDDVVIGTKIFDPSRRQGLSTKQYRDRIINYCEESLKRLNTDYVDILYVHAVDTGAFVREESVAEAMQLLRRQGKARHIGVSTHKNMHEVIQAVNDTGVYEVVLTVINFALQDYTDLHEAIRNAAAKGIGIIAMKTQAGSHQWARPDIGKKYDSKTAATAALKWVLRNENITTAVPGYTTYEHMREDFSVAYDIEFSERERELLAENEIRLGMGFCRQCELCLDTCPRGVDIPALMKTHLYAVQYGNFHQARATLGGIRDGAGLESCRSCPACVGKCARFIDIAKSIEDLKLLYA